MGLRLPESPSSRTDLASPSQLLRKSNSRTISAVQVVVRFRPPVMDDEQQDSISFSIHPNGRSVSSADSAYVFDFNKAFGEAATQDDIFEAVGKPIVSDVLSGYNGTILAYGQTSSGKTHSMYGPGNVAIDSVPSDLQGIVPKASRFVFDHIEASVDYDTEITLRCSFMEDIFEVPGGRELPNKSHFFVQSLPAGPRRQRYCPSVYGEDVKSSPTGATLLPRRPRPTLDSTTDKVAEMRSRILSLKELRTQTDGDSHAPETTPVPDQPAGPPAASVTQPQERLASIMSFLDEVEESSKADISSIILSTRSSRTSGENEVSRPLIPSGLTQDAAAVQSRASMLEVEVQDKKHIIDSLKRALHESQDPLTVSFLSRNRFADMLGNIWEREEREKEKVQATVKEWEEKLQQQKAQYEAGSERHLKLDLTLVLGCVSSEQLLWQRASQVRGEVDRLLNDKTELTRRCELFSDELKAVERKYQMKIEEMEDHAAKELAKNKQNWIATERLKREAWEKDKVKEIKDMTVKGLQPEVERILAERKQEKVRLEEQKTEALEEQRRELLSLAQQQLQELREQKHREMEAALDREREAHRQKVRDEFERFSRELQEERTKCAADLLAERRLREELIRQAAEGSEVKLREALAAERARLQSSLNEAGERLAEANRQHQDQLSQLEARLRAEAEGSHKAQKEKARLETEEREASLRKELAAERDRQLEVVMDRLSREHVERQLAMETEANRKLQEARAAAGEETARVAKQLEEARAEVKLVQQQKKQLEEMLSSMKDCQTASAERFAECQQKCMDLECDRNELRKAADEVLRKHQNELQQLEDTREKELQDLRQSLGEAMAQIKEEQAKLEEVSKESQRREEQIIADLEAKVKRTLQAKDETIGELRKRCTALDNKVSEFGYLLERQREELLSGLLGEPCPQEGPSAKTVSADSPPCLYSAIQTGATPTSLQRMPARICQASLSSRFQVPQDCGCRAMASRLSCLVVAITALAAVFSLYSLLPATETFVAPSSSLRAGVTLSVKTWMSSMASRRLPRRRSLLPPT
eukprot:s1629_g2.t2